MTHLFIGLMTLLVGVTGCVSYHHPTASLAQKQRDRVECAALSEQGAGPSGSLFRETKRGQLLSACYQSRGWIAQ